MVKKKDKVLKILHIINSLDKGGAENLLTQLSLNDNKNVHHIIALKSLGYNKKILENNKITVYSIRLTKNPISFLRLIKIFKIIRSYSPELVQTWLYHSDLIGGIIAKVLGIKKIYWNIRHTDINSNNLRLSTRLIIRLLSLFSKIIPNKIIFCSEESMNNHKAIGFDQKKFRLIHNGINLHIFNTIENIEDKKNKLGISNDSIIFGMIARFHPYKDHETLLKALSLIKSEGFKFICIFAGVNMDKKNKILSNMIFKYNLQSYIRLLGQKNEISQIMNVIDIGILSTHSESFPNVLAEQMACKVPCIASDQGATKLIIGETGWVVPPRNAVELKNSLLEAISEFNQKEKWNIRRNKARERIIKFFSIDLMIKKYNKEWNE